MSAKRIHDCGDEWNIVFLFTILIREIVVFFCIIDTNTFLMREYKFGYTHIKCHLTTDRTIGFSSKRWLILFIETDKIESWSIDFVWMVSESIENSSLFRMYTTRFIRYFFMISVFWAATSSLWFMAFWWSIASYSDTFVVWDNNTSTFWSFAGCSESYFCGLIEPLLSDDFILSREKIHILIDYCLMVVLLFFSSNYNQERILKKYLT